MGQPVGTGSIRDEGAPVTGENRHPWDLPAATLDSLTETSVLTCRSLYFVLEPQIPVEVPRDLLLAGLGTGIKGRNRNRHDRHQGPFFKHIRQSTHLPTTI